MKIAQHLRIELDKLKGAVQKAAVRSVVEHYMDPVGPLNALEKAANAPPGEDLFSDSLRAAPTVSFELKFPVEFIF